MQGKLHSARKRESFGGVGKKQKMKGAGRGFEGWMEWGGSGGTTLMNMQMTTTETLSFLHQRDIVFGPTENGDLIRPSSGSVFKSSVQEENKGYPDKADTVTAFGKGYLILVNAYPRT